MEQKKILKNYIVYFLVGLLICLVGMTNVFADTTVDTSQFFTVTGRKWSAGSLEFASNPAFNNDWLLNSYNVTGGIYTPPNSYDYIEFSYFEHNTSQFNPCNSSGKFTAEFNLLFTSATFNQYVSSVKWGNDSCSIQERNQDGTMKVSCVASPSSNNYTDVFVYYNDIQGISTSSLYISRNIGITCGLNTDAIINNDNANTQNIINNNNQNTQQIIDSSASNTQSIIDSNKVCKTYDNTNTIQSKTINDNGVEQSSNNVNVSDYISLSSNDELYLLNNTSSVVGNFCFYNVNKSKISCTHARDINVGEITIPSNTSYFRYTISKTENKPTYQICKNGNQSITDSITGLDDTINDSDIDNSDAVDFFSNFNDNTHGLSGIISAPLVAINSMLDNQCTPQTATWEGQTISLPCGYDFWSRLSTFKQFLNIALDGLICYRILVKLFKLIENIKNPEDDRVEVMDL